jgi:hypothetical protein
VALTYTCMQVLRSVHVPMYHSVLSHSISRSTCRSVNRSLSVRPSVCSFVRSTGSGDILVDPGSGEKKDAGLQRARAGALEDDEESAMDYVKIGDEVTFHVPAMRGLVLGDTALKRGTSTASPTSEIGRTSVPCPMTSFPARCSL